MQISSLIDTWLMLRDIEIGGERNRGMYVLKSRGLSHSNQIREFLLTSDGIDLVDVYTGPEGVLTGSARQAKEAQEKAARVAGQNEVERMQRQIDRKREMMEAKVAALRAEFEAEQLEAERRIGDTVAAAEQLSRYRKAMAQSRHAEPKQGVR
jgi:circadian clock protein KaiC